MTTTRLAPLARGLFTTALIAVLAAGMATAPAAADELVATDTAATRVAAAPASPTRLSAPRAAASVPRGIVVTNTHGQPVKVFAKGQPIRRAQRLGVASTTFTGLTAGTTYTVSVGGRTIGSVRALDRPAPATALSVRTTDAAGSVSLTWRHRATTATGGSRIRYEVTATSSSAPTVRETVTGRRSALLVGLDPSALYTFTVTPRNSAGAGRATKAVMTRSLKQIAGPGPVQVESLAPTVQVAPAAAPPAPAPTSAPAPAPAPTPATKTIYVCPDGYTQTSTMCEKRLAYTFTTKAYTYHQEPTGPAPLLDSYETTANGCPTGYSLEDYVWIKFCRKYGPVPTRTVKDATPAGYTDDGTAWVKKNPTPDGFTDNGTEWIRVVPREARIVPA